MSCDIPNLAGMIIILTILNTFDLAYISSSKRTKQTFKILKNNIPSLLKSTFKFDQASFEAANSRFV
ncbi:MAG: hypothetical protein RLZ08_1128, partial [Pseudomonadota bacterium]